jgi:hypothetical protein
VPSNSIVPVLTVSSVVACCVTGPLIYGSTITQIGALGAVSVMFSAFVAYQRFRNFGISDSLGIFASLFAAYNGLIPLQVAILGEKDTIQSVYPIGFSEQTYLAAAAASALASVGLLAGSLLLRPRRTLREQLCAKAPTVECVESFFIVGCMGTITGLAMMIIDYGRIGGFIYALAISRVTRYQILADSRGGLPYQSFILVGLCFMFFGAGAHKRSLKVCLLCAAGLTWTGILLVQGDRRPLLYMLLGFFVINESVQLVRTSGKRILTLLVAFYCFSTLISSVRSVFPFLVEGSMNLSEALVWTRDHVTANDLLPDQSEFAGPYIAVLYEMQSWSGYRYGLTYAEAIPNVLPRSLYPGEKPAALNETLAWNIGSTDANGSVSGWGYSPVAEAYINFGFAGIPLVFAAFSVAFGVMSRLPALGPFGLVLCAAITPQMLNLNRINMSHSVQEAVFDSSVAFLLLLFATIVQRAVWRKRAVAPYGVFRCPANAAPANFC